MDHETAVKYLQRIGAAVPPAPTAEGLRELHLRHLRTVPFENLSIHLGEQIVLEEATLVDKIIRRRRGGFCYELNGLFAELLRALGFEVTLLAAYVVIGDNLHGPPFDHMALVVDLDERYLADVGFGEHSTYPLRLDCQEAQQDPAGEFLMVDAPGGDIDVWRNGKPRYRLETRPRTLTDFVPTCWWQQSSPDSHFTRGPTCSRITEDGRITISGDRLIRTVGEHRTESTLDGDDTILAAYQSHFGFELTRLPTPPRTPVTQ